MRAEETYISVDVEASGPIPGDYSMLSIGAAAFQLPNETPLSTFTANLEMLNVFADGFHHETLQFWRQHPKEFAACRESQVHPRTAMSKFADWLSEFPHVVMVAYPLNFDGPFVNWYFQHFIGRNPFGQNPAGLDIKTLAFARLCRQGKRFRGTTKRAMPRRWFGEMSHSHLALDDAIEQGVLFTRIMQETL